MLETLKILVRHLKTTITLLQLPILYISYYFFKIIKKRDTKYSWVIGVDEIAGNIYFLKNILKPSISVSFSKNTKYNFKYDYSINLKNIYLKYLYRLIYAPLLLGYLANKSTHFWYIWNSGFLMDRDYEFKFLKSKNIKIICMFCGGDIRSIKLTNAYAKKNKIDMHTYYEIFKVQNMQNSSYDINKKKLAQSADRYADIVFSHKMCQINLLKIMINLKI